MRDALKVSLFKMISMLPSSPASMMVAKSLADSTKKLRRRCTQPLLFSHGICVQNSVGGILLILTGRVAIRGRPTCERKSKRCSGFLGLSRYLQLG
jgi:hypothetical protein